MNSHLPSIKELVTNQKVHFQMYRKGELWYKTDSGFVFPVPVSDTGDGDFLVSDKAMFFMRYIRKHLENLKTEQDHNNTSSTPNQAGGPP